MKPKVHGCIQKWMYHAWFDRQVHASMLSINLVYKTALVTEKIKQRVYKMCTVGTGRERVVGPTSSTSFLYRCLNNLTSTLYNLKLKLNA